MLQKIEKIIFKTVCESGRRLTPIELQKRIILKHGFPKKQINKALNTLMESGDLVYSYTFGCNFIEKSFNRAVRISERVILKPPNVTLQAAPDDIVVAIQKGASFGTGAHPTTRLAVKAIERALSYTDSLVSQKKLCALDIGTGTGVLAITAVRLGIDSAIGLDIDPCAISEARKNVSLNGLQGQVFILNSTIETFAGPFFLIIANLRYPTLKSLYYNIGIRMEEGGVVVLAGIKNGEVEDLLKTYARNFFDFLWQFKEKGWSSLVLRKTKQPIVS